MRPHQVGNPDAIQYTPVFNGLSAWQLYHGDGFWQPARFPSTSGSRCGSSSRTTACARTSPARRARAARGYATRRQPGGVGILVGGDDLLLGALRWSAERLCCRRSPPEPRRRESSPAGRCRRRSPSATWPRSSPPSTTWTTLDAEPSGLADLARVNPARRRRRHGARARCRPRRSRAARPARARLQRPRGRASERHAALPRRRLVPLARLPLPRQHRLVRHGLPAAAGGARTSWCSRSARASAAGACKPRFPDAAGLRF